MLYQNFSHKIFHQILELLPLEIESEEDLYQIFFTVAQQIFERKKTEDTFIIGISGAQGSGKTTLSILLKALLENHFSWNVVQISLDDYYLSHNQRQQLAQTIHPLLQTRGVPGTHDIESLLNVLNKVSLSTSDESILIQRFNKLSDNPYPKTECDTFIGKADVIILEGWCLGSESQSIEILQIPINDLERNEDPDLIWRTFVNNQLKNRYSTLFQAIDFMIFLNIPAFDKVYEWRWLQERQMAQQNKKNAQQKIMNQEEIVRFVAHFERITRNLLKTMPQKADIVLQISENHQLRL